MKIFIGLLKVYYSQYSVSQPVFGYDPQCNKLVLLDPYDMFPIP